MAHNHWRCSLGEIRNMEAYINNGFPLFRKIKAPLFEWMGREEKNIVQQIPISPGRKAVNNNKLLSP